MAYLNNLKLLPKLLLMLAFPVVGVVFLSLGATAERYFTYMGTTRLAALSTLTEAVSDLVHETQRERGMALAYVNSHGKSFSAQLEQQWQRTDERFRHFDEQMEGARRAGKDQGLTGLLKAAHVQGDRLREVRGALRAGRMSAAEVIDYYGGLNRPLLELVERLPRLSSEGAVTTLLVAFGHLLRAEEDAGIERALVGRVLDSGVVGLVEQERLKQLILTEDVNLRQFAALVPVQLEQQYRDGLTSKVSNTVHAMRAKVTEAAVGSAVNADVARWYQASAQRIDDMNVLAGGLSAALEQQVHDLRRNSWVFFVVVVGMTVFGLAATVVLMYLVSTRIATQVRRLLATLRAFAEGDMSERVEVDSQDEFGQIAAAVNRMAGELESSVSRERQQRQQEQQQAMKFRDAVDSIAATLRLIAFGDLTQQVVVPEDEELAQLAYNINMMTNGLRELTREMVGATENMAVSTAELQQATTAQAAAASEQASSANETMTTLEEIRVISGQSREKAQALGVAADRAMHEGDEGRKQVAHSVSAMETIRNKVEGIGANLHGLQAQAGQIEKINTAVAGVAELSKMLALNAAIEAAKAGTAGRGFAVVAREVKDLADQSVQATTQVNAVLKDVRHAIADVVRGVEEGTWEIVQALQAVEQTGTTVERLSTVVQETATASKQIVAAVGQEAIGIDQLAVAVGEITKATSQFAATTRQLEGAALNLGGITDALRQHASVYEV